MFLKSFPSGPFDTNAYIIACLNTKQAIIIDPAPESFEILKTSIKENELTPIAVWLTHSHWDHIADVKAVTSYYQIPVYIHRLDAPNLQTPGVDGLPCWLDIPGTTPDLLFKEGDLLSVGNHRFQVIETPGHTPGGVCFYCKEEGVLISGDTLFKGTIGNISFPTADAKSMWQSLKKLATLPERTRVYPGHGPATMIGNEPWLSRAEEFFS